MPKVYLIVSYDDNLGFARDGKIPWKLPTDKKYFKHLTSTTENFEATNALIMGRKTWESLPVKPLPERENVIITSHLAIPGIIKDMLLTPSLSQAIFALQKQSLRRADGSRKEIKIEKIFLIGGEMIYGEGLNYCDGIYVTEIHGNYFCDKFFPDFSGRNTPGGDFLLANIGDYRMENGIQYRFLYYQNRITREEKIPEEIFPETYYGEEGYLHLLEKILKSGTLSENRTGTNTICTFGETMRFSLKTFPLLTTKKMFFRGIFEELMFFIRGQTDNKYLKERGIKIWESYGTREYLDSHGFSARKEGDLGPIYGFQWRHFGADYGTAEDDYTGKGKDQLAEVIHLLKTEPTSRRIILSAWNPLALDRMVLPPCHMICQFFVSGGELSCALFQRSADMGLGVPFNIASYALLTYFLAQICGLVPREFVHFIGNAHIYSNHISGLSRQVERTPKFPPNLILSTKVAEIEHFEMDDVRLENYCPDEKIELPMN